MSAILMDGRAVAKEIRERVKEKVQEFTETYGFAPKLATVLVGDDPGSVVYVGLKQKAATDVGLQVEGYRLPATVSQQEVLSLIDRLNADPTVHGILVQHPLPKGLDENRVMQAIAPSKDVDGLTPYSLGYLAARSVNFVPCTPLGAFVLLKRYGVEVEGKRAVVIGRSRINGMPAALLFLMQNATVTVCHTRTRDLSDITREADLLYVSVGRAEFVTGAMVKLGAAVLDTGYNKLPDRKGDVGDVHFDSVREVAGFLTPVPGGIGPMTVTMLLSNTLKSALRTVGAPDRLDWDPIDA